MSKHFPPKFKPLAPLASAPETGDAARAQMIEDSKVTRANVLGAMDIPDAQRAELENALAMISQMLIGESNRRRRKHRQGDDGEQRK